MLSVEMPKEFTKKKKTLFLLKKQAYQGRVYKINI